MGKGLHSQVNRMYQSLKEGGRSDMTFYEEAYNFFYKAERFMSECQYVPDAFFKDYDSDFGLRDELKTLWKGVFSCLPYLSIRGYHEKRCPLAYKIWMKAAKRLIKQRKRHYASMYFASLISYWMFKDWHINDDDVYSPYGDLEKIGLEILNKPWVQAYNAKHLAEDKELKE